MVFDFQVRDGSALRTSLRNCIADHTIGWTQTQLTLRKIIEDIEGAPVYDAIMPRDEVCHILSELAEPSHWDFLIEITYETANE
jgi:hypothetical protein